MRRKNVVDGGGGGVPKRNWKIRANAPRTHPGNFRKLSSRYELLIIRGGGESAHVHGVNLSGFVLEPISIGHKTKVRVGILSKDDSGCQQRGGKWDLMRIFSPPQR